MESNEMIGCGKGSYAKRKANLMHQLGYHDVDKSMFKGMSEIQIDNRVREIMSKPPKGYRI